MYHTYALALETDSPLAASSLTAAERRACAALPTDDRRRDWRAGRLAAKRAVARALGVADLRAIELRPRPAASPLVLLRGAPHQLSLSIAHAGARAAAVVVPGTARVGVDLERDHSIDPAHARYFLTASERAAARRVGLTALWVLKEAAWKALALDARVPFTALDLLVDGDGSLRGLSLCGRRRAARGQVVRPWRDALLAVVLA